MTVSKEGGVNKMEGWKDGREVEEKKKKEEQEDEL